jgi:hypothetical protein
VSPRRHRRRDDDARAVDDEGARRGVDAVQQHRDGDYLVRQVGGATKTYRCPGCDQEIRPAVVHVVAWPADDRGDLTDRRHWHTGCWRARERRTPGLQRSRNAPRYG